MSDLKNKNYYEILEVNRTCSQEDISEAYRNLSLQYHPSRATPDKKEVYELHFQKLAEAYEVLSDPVKKGIFDIYGAEGLRKGITDKNGNIKGAYKFLNNDLRTTNIVEVSQDVEIFRGYNDKTVITYREKGNDSPGMTSSDLIVYIKELPHSVFRRINKNDLLYVHKIPLVKALNSEPVCLHTLDGRKWTISIDEIISPSTVKVVPGEGMPIYDKDLSKCRGNKIKKGDLYIKFNIIFPEYIEPAKKKRIITLLKEEE